MKKLLSLLSIFAIVLSCSSDETSTPVTPPPAPIVKYTITLSAGEGGTVSTTGGEYEAGQTVSVTATPQGEYVFTSWSDGNTNATRTITVSSNSTLTASFEKRKYPLTINFEGEGEVIEEIVNSGRTTEYDSGTTVKLTAQAAAEWVFIGWTGDIESTEESVQIVIGEPKEVTATFEKKKYPLTVNIEGQGEVLEEILNSGRSTDYDSGTTVKLTAEPADEWLFTGWSGDIGDIDPTENPIQLSIIESKTVTATFEKKKYPLTVNIEGEGEVLEEIIDTGKTTDYDSGTTVKLTAVPAEGWEFVAWTGAIESTELEVQLLVSEAKEVNAVFKKSILFSYATPNYPKINFSSGTVVQNKYAPPFLLTADFIYENIAIYEDCNLPRPGVDATDPIYDNYTAHCQTTYLLFENNYKYLDYNDDGKPDLFGFIAKGGSQAYNLPGKFVLVNDVFNDFDVKYFDSDLYFLGISEINDFTNDGKLDLIVYGSEDHNDNSGNPNSPVSFRKPLTLVQISDQGNISTRPIGPPTSSHDITSLDYDNDGDIDIINFEYYLNTGAKEHQEKPIVYVNDGSGNFEVREDIFLMPDEFYNYSDTKDFWVNAGDSFDLNNDGYLDLVIGWGNTNTDSEPQECYKENERGFIEYCGTYEYPYMRGFQIVWGSKEGIFDYTKSTFINLDLENFSSKGTLGFNFIDLNRDNKYDILVNGQAGNYSYSYIDFYINNGDKTFTRQTDTYVSENSWLNTSVNGEIPMPYTFNIIDLDQDGNFDLSPSYFISGGNIFESVKKGKQMIGPNFYFKNTGEKFILQKDLIDSKFKN